MPRGYIPILIFLVVAFAFPVVTILAAKLVRPSAPNKAKLEAYECGIPTDSDTRGRYSVHFYLVAILFVIFDVETIFLIPWAIQYNVLGLFGLIEMLVFLAILIVGYVWIFRQGALKWV
ncbi:MAG TPA: NADH-quinone oxidoreductase subunit A [Bryobacterales bacterium]|nr:NADH-quinone oxidoreductase subunit A [Bryobacterales bacterium]